MTHVIGVFAEVALFAIVAVFVCMIVQIIVQIVDVVAEETSHMPWRRKDQNPRNTAEDRDDVSI